MANPQSTGVIQPPVPSPDIQPVAAVLPAVAAVQKVTAGFDRVGLAGRPQRMCVEINGADDPTLDPRFLGEAPEEDPDGTCSYCGDPYFMHWDSDREEYLSGREWHRRDCRERAGDDGFYSDEIPAVTR